MEVIQSKISDYAVEMMSPAACGNFNGNHGNDMNWIRESMKLVENGFRATPRSVVRKYLVEVRSPFAALTAPMGSLT